MRVAQILAGLARDAEHRHGRFLFELRAREGWLLVCWQTTARAGGTGRNYPAFELAVLYRPRRSNVNDLTGRQLAVIGYQANRSKAKSGQHLRIDIASLDDLW